MVDDAERGERLKEIHDNHIRRVFRKEMLQRDHAVRVSLLLWVTFIMLVVLLTTSWRVVSVDSAVGFLLGMLATLFVGVLEEEPFEDEIRSEEPRHDRLVLFLVGLGFAAWFGLFLGHRVDLAYGVATGFWVGLFSVARIYRTPRYGG
jgi:hypothetical protein